MSASDADRYLIVGGGPAAAATALALVERRQPVTILDAGLTLEPERESARQRLGAVVPGDWTASDLRFIRYPGPPDNGLATKYLFGSDVAFRDDGRLAVHKGADVGAVPSYARGGLSTVWGAGLLSYTDADVSDWPVSNEELDAHARSVLEHLPYAAAHDELEARYPILRDPDGSLARSDIAEQMLRRFRKHRSALQAAGYSFGGARLAVRVGRPAPEFGCIYCRRCLDGCAYGHIYNAADTIAALAGSGLVDYQPGVHVEQVEDAGERVRVQATQLSDGAALRFEGRRVFLGAGALGTTVILQRSALLPARVELLDSQTLFIPMIWEGRSGKTASEAAYTLAQAFMVLDEASVSAHPIHLSLYTYNDGLADRARALRPRLSAVLGPLVDRAAHRLVIGICFLHSDDSRRFSSTLMASDPAVRLAAIDNPSTTRVIGRFQRALLRSLPRVGLLPLGLLTEIAPAGGGFHYGGSMPMRTDPLEGECDVLGRPAGRGRIHAVDATCFPAIPGGTITLPAMANAHRIAAAALDEDLA